MFVRRLFIGSHPFRWMTPSCSYAEGPSNSQSSNAICTTGYSFVTSDGKRKAKFGVYFGPDDERNTLEEMDGATHVAAMITAVLTAIQKRKSSDPVTIRTDFKLKGDYRDQLSQWASRDFQKYQGGDLPNSDLLKQLHDALSNKEIILEFIPSVVDQQRNYVTDLLLSSKIFRARQMNADSFVSSTLGVKSGEIRDSKGHSVRSVPKDWPVVYVKAGFSRSNNDFASASYATLWPSDPTGISLPHRLALLPVTLFRAQMAAIEEALIQANERELPRVVVKTDSAHFIKYWKSGWVKSNGKPADNKFIFDRIRDLANKRGMEVLFQYEEAIPTAEWLKLMDSCEEGLSFPIVGQNRSEYELSLDEMVEENVSRRLAGSGTPRVRIYKKGTNLPAGLLWDTVDSSTSAEFFPMASGALADVALVMLEQAASRSHRSLVVRTDSARLVRSVESWLPVWRRRGWRDSLHQPIAHADTWIKVDKLRRDIKIYWELMTPLTEEDVNLVTQFKKPRKSKKVAVNI